jgi:hypothetical protein
MTGNGSGYTYASFAGNAKGMTVTPTGASAAEIDNATGAQIGRDAIEKMASAYMWGKAWDAAGKLIEEGFDAVRDGNETDVRINDSNNSTKVDTFVPPPPQTAQ